MKQYLSLFLILSIYWVGMCSTAVGQNTQHEIEGMVTDESDGGSLPGVNISVKGTTIGTSSGTDGSYQLAVPSANDTLVFSFIGYKTQEVPINGRTTIDVAMVSEALIGEELVVTGYQTQKKADLTGAVSIADVEDIGSVPTGNPMKSLQGRIPGLSVTTDGSPNGNTTIRIRGVNTLGNNDPLFVIDGVPTKTAAYQQLNPNAIESIQVLKDAAASSIYGARASNGVIIITTKEAGSETKVDFNTSLSMQSYVTKLDVLNTRQRGQVLWQAAINDNVDPSAIALYDYEWHQENDQAVLDRVIVPKWVDKEAGIKSANTNWYDKISRRGVISSSNLSVSTGNERGGVMLSLSYHDNAGIIKENDFNRISGRINSDYNFWDGRLQLGGNVQVSKTKETPIPEGLGGTPMWLGLIAQPILPVHTVDGGWAGPSGAGFSDRDNPVRLIEHNKWDKNHALILFGNVFADLEIIQNLTLRSNFGVDYEDAYYRDITRTYQSGFLGRDINSLNTVQNHNINWTWSNTLNYVLNVSDHNITLMGGIEASRNIFSSFTAYSEEFAIEENDYFTHDAATGRNVNSGSDTGYNLFSYFGKVDYAYSDRYLASATLRYDGSSRFGQDQLYGLFPAFSAGWRLANEPFFRENVGFISQLKLRAGWGRVGNQEIANYASYSLYRANYGDDKTWGGSSGTAYDIGGNDTGTLPSGYVATQTGNPNLKWEETTEVNVGADFGILSDKLTGSFDYFVRNTEDILIQPAFIGVVGDGGNRWLNGASTETSGFELALGYQNSVGDFSYTISGNISSYSDKITHLPESVVDSYPGNSEKDILGRSQFSLFGYVADGLFQNQQEVDNHAQQPGKGIGRIRYKDLNGDGTINSLDQKYIGVASPEFQYGLQTSLKYKNVTLDLFFQGIQGIEVYNEMKFRTDFVGQWSGANFGARTLDAWTPQNSDSSIPAVSLSDNNSESRFSTYYVENGSYLKLRTAKLGYSLPSEVLDSVGMRNLTIYLQGENLLTFKDNHGADQFTATDPENPANAYPRPLTLTLGLNVSF
ncbi:MAG TPA: TonB-dependent receptor [Fodinibius sp.]|nr:TonB-dependent receptor [Fodinibius sp.]